MRCLLDEVFGRENFVAVISFRTGTSQNTKVIERCILMTTEPGDLVFDPRCVRKGTRVGRVDSPPKSPRIRGDSPPKSPRTRGDSPPQSPRTRGEENEDLSLRAGEHTDPLPVDGEGWGGAVSLPASGEGWGGASLIPIEAIQAGDWVLTHDGTPHRVLGVIHRPFKGRMVGIRHSLSDAVLWLTDDHQVLAKPRPRTLGGQRDWSGIPKALRGRSKELRREMTPPERKLWSQLRNGQIGFTFRRQHPIGPYIADFYSREARLVVEVDGAVAHGTEAAIAHDAADGFLKVP